MTQSLTRRVADAINARGSGTAADLQPLFPEHTLRQLVDALHHAKEARLVSLEAKGRSLGRGKGWALSTYGRYAPPALTLPRVSSVFDLGSRFAAHA